MNEQIEITSAHDELIPDNIMNAQEWLDSLSDDDLLKWAARCSVGFDRSSDDERAIALVSMLLYSREMGMDSIPRENEVFNHIFTTFCSAVQMGVMCRFGLAVSQGPITLYKNCQMEITQEGREWMIRRGLIADDAELTKIA